MELKILELNLRNFKGIKDLKLTPGGSNLNVYGENATGKTTIMDAFIWLLFDKDSQNSSNFNIKTLDKNGNVIHGLEHEVSATILINDKKVELQKIYKEKWTKKRGQAESELTSHTTDHFINAVPKKKSEYNDYLSQIIDEDTFKIVTNPLYFNKSIDWKKRRSIALEICGEVDDQEVIDQDEKLSNLRSLLSDKSVDDLKAEMSARRKKLNEELKSIPYRIDELSRVNTDVDVKGLTKERKELQGKLNDLKNSKEIDYDFRLKEVNSSISICENEIKELEQKQSREIRQNIDEIMKSSSLIKKSYYESRGKVEELSSKIYTQKSSIDRLNKELEDFRNKFTHISSQTFDEGSTICPTCKQSLPFDEIERHKLEFLNYKQQALSEINSTGKSKKVELEEIIAELTKDEVEYEKEKEQAQLLYEIVESKNLEIKGLERELESIDVREQPLYKENQSKIRNLNIQKQGLLNLINQQNNEEELKNLEAQISTIDIELAKVDLAKENEKRANSLKSRERELAQMIAETEKIEFLCEQFVISKSSLLEDKLNNKFSLVKFKLFDVQVNGGINETFVTTVDGVPFEDLNNAMKINAGLDIINTLTGYYVFKAPIFIDNRESVNEIVDVKSQVINLIVSKDKKLKVEVKQ